MLLLSFSALHSFFILRTHWHEMLFSYISISLICISHTCVTIIALFDSNCSAFWGLEQTSINLTKSRWQWYKLCLISQLSNYLNMRTACGTKGINIRSILTQYTTCNTVLWSLYLVDLHIMIVIHSSYYRIEYINK